MRNATEIRVKAIVSTEIKDTTEKPCYSLLNFQNTRTDGHTRTELRKGQGNEDRGNKINKIKDTTVQSYYSFLNLLNTGTDRHIQTELRSTTGININVIKPIKMKDPATKINIIMFILL